MKFKSIVNSSVRTLDRSGGKAVPFLIGPPGGGKSQCALRIAESWGADHVFQFFASTKEPSDFAVPGINTELGIAEFFTQHMFGKYAIDGEYFKEHPNHKVMFIFEEVSDATVAMQNALCGVILDRKVGEEYLHPNVALVCTGNRTEDKSGANRLMSKLSNRVVFYDFETNLDQWVDWALAHDIDPMIIQFVRFKPGLLHEFDPNRRSNPTPRAWAMANWVDPQLPLHEFQETLAGIVGLGAATEYVAFRDVASKIPDIEELLKNPKKAPVPSDPATLYALVGALAHNADEKNFDKVIEYVDRLPPEFSVMCVVDATKLKGDVIKRHPAFVKWAIAHASVII